MKTFRIHFNQNEREAVLDIVSRSNDVVIDQIEVNEAVITIQQDDDKADDLYDALVTRIDKELHSPNVL